MVAAVLHVSDSLVQVGSGWLMNILYLGGYRFLLSSRLFARMGLAILIAALVFFFGSKVPAFLLVVPALFYDFLALYGLPGCVTV